jgi:hypothetical protein
MKLHVKAFEEEMTYTGEELRALWIYHRTNLRGNALISFEGPCQVSLGHMVDQEDVKAKEGIRSDRMLHFMGEIFESGAHSLEMAILRQRLWIQLIADSLFKLSPVDLGGRLFRRGDDLYLDEGKLSVSITTVSGVSNLTHIGLNISQRGTPKNLSTSGLEDIEVSPKALQKEFFDRASKEWTSCLWARCKVLPV